MYSYFLNYKDPLEDAQMAKRVELIHEQELQTTDFRALEHCGCWVRVEDPYVNIDGTRHSEKCQVIEVPAPPPRVDIQWTWFPSFLSTDVRMHNLLEAALKDEWAGKLTPEVLEGPTGEELHTWICTWVASQFPFYKGLRQWLLDMVRVQPRG